MILESDTSHYAGNATLNDAARRGDLETVQRLIVGEPDWNKWQAAMQAWGFGQWKVVDALLEAGVGEQGRNTLIQETVCAGVLEWTEHLLREGTSEQARGFAVNRLAETRERGGDRPAELDERHQACLRAVLAAGVAADDLRHARKRARANGDKLLAAWLAD